MHPVLAETLLLPGVQQGFAHFYALEYDRAIVSFERVLAEREHPEAPLFNYLLQAELFRHLYRHYALDTTLYVYQGNQFLAARPLPMEEPQRQRIEEITEQALALSEERLRKNPRDVAALYHRGVTRGLRSSYMAMVERRFTPALRAAVGARNDHERVLQLDPTLTDAMFAVGVHNYVVGSLPFYMRAITAIAGMGGNKNRGLEMLQELAAADVPTSPDARVALALFLRREGKYELALQHVAALVERFPRNYLFALERANLLKDGGRGSEAIEAYHVLLQAVGGGRYPNAQPELAEFGLGESLRGQHRFEPALQAYLAVLNRERAGADLRQRAGVAAGQMLDLLDRRERAQQIYSRVLEVGPADSTHARAAQRHLREPYRENRR